jgi:hypothetical protein
MMIGAKMVNPYAPPQHDADSPVVHPPSADGAIVGTTALTEADMAAGLAMANKRLWFFPLLFGLLGFISMSSFGLTAQLIGIPVAAGIGYFAWRNVFRSAGRRALANKSDGERTVTWRFTPESIEITNPLSYTRFRWAAVHRWLDGKDTLAFYSSESVVQIVPLRAFRADEIEKLRQLFRANVTPRKKPRTMTYVAILWMVLVLMFLAIWQFLQSGK